MGIRLIDLIDILGKPINSGNKKLEVPLAKISTDSRKFEKGSFFIALVGSKFDGHKFLNDVSLIGAQAAVISKESSLPVPKNLLHWIVDDTIKAYQDIASLHRRTLSIPVIAVTGSVGKTTTKEMIHSALMPLGKITSSSLNNNNDIGVPLTLLSATETDTAIVVEMGMRGFGQIERLSKCARPDIAVITNIGSAHLALLGSRRNIAIAKCEITSYLKSSGVVIIMEGDALLEEVLLSKWQGRIIRVGVKSKRSFDLISDQNLATKKIANNIDMLGILDEDKWQLLYQNKCFRLPVSGRHNAKNFMLALAVANELNISFDLINELQLPASFGRNQSFIVKGITILDETYNASPESVSALLDFLKTKKGRRFAVLGNMYELGSESVTYHKKIVEHAVHTGLTGLIVCGRGDEVDAMVLAGINLSYVELVSTPEEAFDVIKKWLRPGDYLLLKASRKVALDRLIPLIKGL